jgi:predicted GH43/DUF377 family glycosyl hydrolase
MTMGCETYGVPVPVDENFNCLNISNEKYKELENYSAESQNNTIVKIRELPGTEGFYNAAVLYLNETHYLLGRQVEKAGKEGEPDIGSLVLKTLDGQGDIVFSEEVWRPNKENQDGEYLLEDARALTLSDGRVAIGLTYVTRKGNDYIPHPAVLVVSSIEKLKQDLPNVETIKRIGKIAINQKSVDGVVGDQTTPIGEDIPIPMGKNVTAIGHNMHADRLMNEVNEHTYSFAFRPEGDDNNHTLQVFEYQEGGEVTHSQYINFPKDISWAEYRIGTTMPPVWLNKNEAIFPIHGIQIVNSKFVYSIGSARLLKDEHGNLSVDNISQNSIINPDSFVGNIDDEVELHGERRVVYCCGGVPTYDDAGRYENLKLYVNVGDKRTVEVTVSIAKMIKDWDRGGYSEELLPIAV